MRKDVDLQAIREFVKWTQDLLIQNQIHLISKFIWLWSYFRASLNWYLNFSTSIISENQIQFFSYLHPSISETRFPWLIIGRRMWFFLFLIGSGGLKRNHHFSGAFCRRRCRSLRHHFCSRSRHFGDSLRNSGPGAEFRPQPRSPKQRRPIGQQYVPVLATSTHLSQRADFRARSFLSVQGVTPISLFCGQSSDHGAWVHWTRDQNSQVSFHFKSAKEDSDSFNDLRGWKVNPFKDKFDGLFNCW